MNTILYEVQVGEHEGPIATQQQPTSSQHALQSNIRIHDPNAVDGAMNMEVTTPDLRVREGHSG